MVALTDVTAPAARAALAEALAAWLPRQRWFAGKARGIAATRVADLGLLGDGLVDVLVDVDYDDGRSERYQVPLSPSAGDARAEVVVRVAGLQLVDATTDDRACGLLAGLAVSDDRLVTAAGASVVGRPIAGGDLVSGDAPRRLSAEQSNTSVVFGDRAILKLFRRLQPGINPDVEVTRVLTRGGFPHTPAQRGALELEAADGSTTTLGVLSDFVAGGRQGWDLARAEVARLLDPDDASRAARTVDGSGKAGGALRGEAGGALRDARTGGAGGTIVEPPLLGHIGDLGRAVAALHLALRRGFGATAAGRGDVDAWAGAMRAQAEQVLTVAAARAPEAAAPVLERHAALLGRLDAIREVADAGPVIRIHGDLHLGQILLDGHGRWQLLDFEGEPARSLAERRSRASPLRDVAGMLRSFDYAAAHDHPDEDLPEATVAWRDQARRRFLDGYAERATAASILGADPAARAALLAAFELDKAVYELGYELANRPDWVPIPVGGIVRVLDAPASGGLRAPRAASRGGWASSNAATIPSAPVEGAPVSPQRDPHPPAAATPPPSPAENRAARWRAAREEIDAVVGGEHQDPHRVLGVHPVDGGAVVRAWRPDAVEVQVVVDGREPVTAERTHDAGFYEAELDEPPSAAAYRLRVSYPDGSTYDLHDPYAFWPTFGEIDLHLAGEGRHEELWRRMGAHVSDVDGVGGTVFAVWAPNARSVRVVGDFNSWDGRLQPMRLLGSSGIWELFLPDVAHGAFYKYEIVTADGGLVTRADPYAFATEAPPGTASRVFTSTHQWRDDAWLTTRQASQPVTSPMSVYEVHLGSWRRGEESGDDAGRGRTLGYRELAHALGEHVQALGFTHVELLPPAEHPFGGSWGYQVTGYFAPTARFGDPDDFRYLVDHLHQRGIGVIVDWVPAHFPRDEWALARFDGTALYEHQDPRRGEHPDWGTLVFNYGRNEVRNFLIANALYWLEELHVDGLRVDAVASMLYLDYSRKEGEWVPNRYGGRENLEAADFLKELNAVVYGRNPSVVTIAEESTAWPGVSRPTYLGGLGFGFKWNMGWMHDTLSYLAHEPVHRRYHHNQLTFALMYAWSENFILPLSHDEVVHGKRSLLDKMPGDRWQKFANLRALYGYMWAHPGKQLLFMGGEFGQWREWGEQRQLDWHLLEEADHAGLQRLVADLNATYRRHPALWQLDVEPEGFEWIDANDSDHNVLTFVRRGRQEPPLVCLSNFSPVVWSELRFGLPQPGEWEEVLNTDAETYGGGNVGNYGTVVAEDVPWHGLPASARVVLPPLATVWLAPRG